MRRDYKRAGITQNLVCREDVGRRANFATPMVDLVLGNVQLQQRMFRMADRRALREDRQDMKAERGGELDSEQDSNPGQETTKLVESSLLIRADTLERLKQLQILNVAPQIGVASNRVMVRKGDQIGSARFGLAQNIEERNVRCLVVGRRRRVNV